MVYLEAQTGERAPRLTELRLLGKQEYTAEFFVSNEDAANRPQVGKRAPPEDQPHRCHGLKLLSLRDCEQISLPPARYLVCCVLLHGHNRLKYVAYFQRVFTRAVVCHNSGAMCWSDSHGLSSTREDPITSSPSGTWPPLRLGLYTSRATKSGHESFVGTCRSGKKY